MGTFTAQCHIYSMNTNKQTNGVKKMTKKDMVKTIVDRFNKMDWFINYHQEKANYWEAEAKLILDNSDMTFQEYEESQGMMNYKSHSSIVREYKNKKDLLNSLLVEITGNYYGKMENKYND